MSKELRELLNQLELKNKKMGELINSDEITKEELEQITNEIDVLQAKIEAQKRKDELEKDNLKDGEKVEDHKVEVDGKNEYRDAFLNVVRGKATHDDFQKVENAAMTEGVPEDGGYIVPQDIQTRINEFKRALDNLETHVRIEPVNTLTGSRVIEKLSDMTPFVDIEEMVDIAEMDNPKFETIKYAVTARGGILPVSNTLLQDTDQNLMNYLSNWIAKKSVVTRNKLITDLLDKLSKTEFKDIKDLKKAKNVTLDPALVTGAKWIMNQDAYNFFDTLDDGNGRPLLQPDPTSGTGKLLLGLPVVIVSNRTLKTTGTTTKKAPCLLGNFKEGIVLFDRQKYEVKTTDVGGKAFYRNSTDIRVIEREDLKLFDEDAMIYGQVTVEKSS